MKKSYLITLTNLILSFLVLLGCNKIEDDKKCIGFIKTPVTKIEGPVTGIVNQEINLAVSFVFFNGCGRSAFFEETTEGNTTTINVTAKYEGCICTAVIIDGQLLYKFKRSQAGTYLLKFFQTVNNYITFTITVQ